MFFYLSKPQPPRPVVKERLLIVIETSFVLRPTKAAGAG